jgi:hypothetical protein
VAEKYAVEWMKKYAEGIFHFNAESLVIWMNMQTAYLSEVKVIQFLEQIKVWSIVYQEK